MLKERSLEIETLGLILLKNFDRTRAKGKGSPKYWKTKDQEFKRNRSPVNFPSENHTGDQRLN